MTPQQLKNCLQNFYLSARRRDGTFYNKKSLTAIRAALDRNFGGILSKIKVFFDPPFIQLAWYILKQLFTSVLVNRGGYLPPLRWIIVNSSWNEKAVKRNERKPSHEYFADSLFCSEKSSRLRELSPLAKNQHLIWFAIYPEHSRDVRAVFKGNRSSQEAQLWVQRG